MGVVCRKRLALCNKIVNVCGIAWDVDIARLDVRRNVLHTGQFVDVSLLSLNRYLHYDDDVNADTDMNVVKTGDGRFVEIQGTAESEPFDQQALSGLLELAGGGIDRLIEAQRAICRPILGR